MSTGSQSGAAPETIAATLRANVIGIPEIVFQSVAAMAPAGAIAFSLGAALPFAGTALPLATLLALLVCLLVATNIAAMAKHLPSAGGYFTYVSRGLGDASGWLAGWLFSLTYILFLAASLLIVGPVLDDFARHYLHVSWGWIAWAIIVLVPTFCLTLVGVKVSAKGALVLGSIEVLIFLALAAWLVVRSPHPSFAATFSPRGSIEHGLGGWQGVLHGMIFTFLAFAGFESAAPLAEEARDPRRTVPRAIVLAVLSIGLLYALCAYAAVVGWGPDRLASYSADPNPWLTMANRSWGVFGILVFFAIVNGSPGNIIANITASARVLFAMGRGGTLPETLAHVNRRYRVPDVAILASVGTATALALWLGTRYGPTTAYALVGATGTIMILIVYVATCAAVPFFYYREHRSELRIGRHVIVPIVSVAVLVLPIWFQFSPMPPAPLNLAGLVCAAWLLLGLVIVTVLRARVPERLAESGRLAVEASGAA